MFFFLACAGELELGWAEFAVGSLGDFVGAFVGAVLVYLYFAPHFWTVPLPQDFDPVSVLLHGTPDALSVDAGRIASAFGPGSNKREGENVITEGRDFAGRIRGGGLGRFEQTMTSMARASGGSEGGERGGGGETRHVTFAPDVERQRLLAKMKVERRARAKTDAAFYASRVVHAADLKEPLLAQAGGETGSVKTIQVAGMLHQHDPKISGADGGDDPSRHSVQVAPMLHEHDPELGERHTVTRAKSEGALPRPTFAMSEGEEVMGRPKEQTLEREETLSSRGILPLPDEREVTFASQKEVRDEAFEAAIAADAHAKLSIFATRPAKYNRPANFFQETVASFVLFFGAEMFNVRKRFESAAGGVTDGPFMQSAFISFFIMVLILGLGGTTSLAVNPARDFGPRLAHAVLPIPGKGPSEWHYAWVPFFAPFVGGGLGSLMYYGVVALYRTGSDEL